MTEVRWNLKSMAELANNVEAKSERLLALRREALHAGELCGRALEMRLTVVAAAWCRQSAEAVRSRRVLLTIAEKSLANDLLDAGRDVPIERDLGLRPRAQEDIENDLNAALSAGREFEAAQLTLEIAIAERNSLLMQAIPEVRLIGQLQRLIDYLSYELAKERPDNAPDWQLATQVADHIKDLLDESWMRDVRRTDLLAVSRVLSSLEPAELDAVISQLEDAHLYRWLREMDGMAGGNLDKAEETEMFHTIAARASAAIIFRVANAEHGGKFSEIAQAVSDSAPADVAIEFIEICAARAGDSQLALTAALSTLAALNPDERVVAYTALIRTGALETLAGATHSFLATQIIERDDPLLVEFLEGVAAALAGTASAMWDLSGALLIDSHHFRESWASLGRTLAMVRQDPVAFAAVVLDIDTLAKNPARWAGMTMTDIAALGVGKLARLGRLGSAAKAVADWLRRFSSRSLGVGTIEVEAGHLVTTLERLHGAADALTVREVIEQIGRVEDLTAALQGFPNEVSDLEMSAALHLMRELGQATESVVDDIATALAA